MAHENILQDIIRAILAGPELGFVVVLHGGSGSGKTGLLNELCARQRDGFLGETTPFHYTDMQHADKSKPNPSLEELLADVLNKTVPWFDVARVHPADVPGLFLGRIPRPVLLLDSCNTAGHLHPEQFAYQLNRFCLAGGVVVVVTCLSTDPLIMALHRVGMVYKSYPVRYLEGQ